MYQCVYYCTEYILTFVHNSENHFLAQVALCFMTVIFCLKCILCDLLAIILTYLCLILN